MIKKAEKAMITISNLKLALFCLFIFFLSVSVLSQNTLNTTIEDEIIELELCDVSDIDIKIKLILDHHIDKIKEIGVEIDTANYYLLVGVELPHKKYFDNTIDSLLDSRYNFSEFMNYDFSPSYLFSVRIVSKFSVTNRVFYTENYQFFYYRYKGIDVLFFSRLPIKIECNPINKRLTLSIVKDNVAEFEFENSLYEIREFQVIELIHNEIYDYYEK